MPIFMSQEALVGEGRGEEQLFFSESNSMRDGIGSELDGYLEKLKVLTIISVQLFLLRLRNNI